MARQMYLPCNSNESTRLPNGSTVSISPYVIAVNLANFKFIHLYKFDDREIGVERKNLEIQAINS